MEFINVVLTFESYLQGYMFSNMLNFLVVDAKRGWVFQHSSFLVGGVTSVAMFSNMLNFLVVDA